MFGMARRKKQNAAQGTPINAAPEVTDDRTSDRHKPRKMVGLSVTQYEKLRELALRNQRPTLWELRIAIDAHLAKNGVGPKSK